jgi:hypothetical protein
MNHRNRIAVLVGAAAVGCMVEPPLPPMENPDCGDYLGSFRGNATGAVTDTMSGCAYFQVAALGGSFGMVLTNGGPNATNPRVRLLRSSFPASPPEGQGEFTFTVGSGNGQLLGHIELGTQIFSLTTGTLIKYVTAEDLLYNEYSLNGRIDVTGRALDGTTIRVTGEFIGVCVESNRSDPLVEDGPSASRSCARADGLFRTPPS